MDKENEFCPEKSVKKKHCQKSKNGTVIVNGVRHTKVPEKIMQEIEKIAKKYGTKVIKN